MSAGNFEQCGAARCDDVFGSERPIEVRVVHDRDAALCQTRAIAVAQSFGGAGKGSAGNNFFRAQRVDATGRPSAVIVLFAGYQDHPRFRQRIVRSIRELVMVGEREELVAMTVVPVDDLLGVPSPSLSVV